jgi:hypothetical protein
VEVSQLHALRSSCDSRPCGAQLNVKHSTHWTVPIVCFRTPRCATHWKLRSSVVASAFFPAGTCLLSRCLETTVFVLVGFEVFAQQQGYTPQYHRISFARDSLFVLPVLIQHTCIFGQNISDLLMLVPRSRIFLPCRCRRCVPPKRSHKIYMAPHPRIRHSS